MALWTPAELNSISNWWDAADSNTLTIVSSAVSSWVDKKDSVSLSQDTPGKRPVLTTINGLSAIDFDGVDDNLVNASPIALFNPLGNHLFVCGRLRRTKSADNDNNDVQTTLEFGQHQRWVATTRNQFTLRDWNLIAWPDTGTTSISNSQTVSTDNTALAVWSVSYDGGSAVAAASYAAHKTGSSQSLTTSSVTGSLGRRNTLSIGGRSNDVQFTDAVFCEILLAKQPLSTADRQLLEGYLAWKWGLQGNLPNDHPYKNAAPTTDTGRRRNNALIGLL